MNQEISLWEHQKTAIERAKSKDFYALFFEMGTGKTLTCIKILQEKFIENAKILKTLILCPPIVIQNWKDEFKRYSPISPANIILLEGSSKKRAKLIRDNKRNCIMVTNYETLLMKECFSELVNWGVEALVADESHKLKDYRAKRTKLATILAERAKYRFLLSGTPVLNSPMDLFTQFKILDGGKTFGKNFFAFRNTYFYDKNLLLPYNVKFPNWAAKKDTKDKIQKAISSCGMRVKKSECLDLPPLLRVKIPVEMSADQKKAYEEMKKDFVTYLNGDACVAELALTKALRLQQIVSGFAVVGDNEKKNVRLDNPRAKALEELLSALCMDSKVIVWAVFKENYETIREVCNKLKLKYVEVHGSISASKKQEAVKAFQEYSARKVFIGHPGSGGIGINLVQAKYSIFYSRGFSLENDLQAEARNYRGGSEMHDKITRYDLYCKDTIDEIILEALENKQQIGESLLKKMTGAF